MKKFLYDSFAERWGKFDQIFLYGDPHFSDEESYQLRGLLNIPSEYEKGSREYELYLKARIDYLDELQIKSINAKAGKNTLLIITGDVGNIECIKKLKAGYKVLIMGNHDKGASNYKRQVFFNENFNETRFYGQLDRRHISSNSYKELEDLGCTNIKEGHPIIEEDNHLFDEVYEGPLMISDRLMISHEPLFPTVSFIYNIHSHVHNSNYKGDEHHLNVIAEANDYTPVALYPLLKKGLLKNIDSIHRETIDKATARKGRK